jgi:enoyl-CoA hydratase/carnithine racemase
MPTPDVKLSVDARGVATISFQGIKSLNIAGSAEVERLTRTVASLAGREDLRLLVLTGAGEKAFIGGADIEEMAKLTPASAQAFITNLHRLCQALRELPVPVIARIRGYCLGGGLEVAAACDLRVAGGDARFGMPEVKVGLPSVIEATLLPYLIGWGRAREIIYTGRIFGAGEALQMGLVEKVVPAHELDTAVAHWVDAILECSPQAIRAQKELFRQWEALPPTVAAEASIPIFARCFESGEPNEYLKRFLQRKR